MNEPWASLDYKKEKVSKTQMTPETCTMITSWSMKGCGRCAYIEVTCVVAVKVNNRLSSRVQLDPVLRTEPGHDLDTICGRHDEDDRNDVTVAVIYRGRARSDGAMVVLWMVSR